MRKSSWMFGLLGVIVSSPVLAQGAPAMVLKLAGEVRVEAIGSDARALEPFSRLLEDDRVKLGQDGSLTLVYGKSGRQETWTGAGVIQIDATQSVPVGGKPALAVKELPAKVTQVMARTPAVDAAGKVGMLRVRSIATTEALQALERSYQDMRRNNPGDDRGPEVYWLAGLFEMGAHDRLKEELAQMEKTYPEDLSLRVLAKLYGRAMNNARQGRP